MAKKYEYTVQTGCASPDGQFSVEYADIEGNLEAIEQFPRASSASRTRYIRESPPKLDSSPILRVSCRIASFHR